MPRATQCEGNQQSGCQSRDQIISTHNSPAITNCGSLTVESPKTGRLLFRSLSDFGHSRGDISAQSQR